MWMKGVDDNDNDDDSDDDDGEGNYIVIEHVKKKMKFLKK